MFANISQMAKVATVSEDDGRPDDGKFEVITVKHTAKWRLLGTALKAAMRGLGPQVARNSTRSRAPTGTYERALPQAAVPSTDPQSECRGAGLSCKTRENVRGMICLRCPLDGLPASTEIEREPGHTRATRPGR